MGEIQKSDRVSMLKHNEKAFKKGYRIGYWVGTQYKYLMLKFNEVLNRIRGILNDL